MKQKNKAEAAPASGQHTPGPWKLGTQDYAYFEQGGETVKHSAQGIDGEGIHDICRVSLCATPDEGMANAHLIAAAPELLEALRECRPWVRKWSGASGLLAMVDAAIAKAEGRGQ